MNKRHVTFYLNVGNGDLITAAVKIWLDSSRVRGMSTVQDSLLFAGASQFEVEKKITDSFRQILVLLSDHDFYVPTKMFEGFDTPFQEAEKLLDQVIVFRRPWNLSEWTAFFLDVKHYGREYV